MLTINLFNGLVYGALLIVMCSGLALIYGLRRVVNFAHGRAKQVDRAIVPVIEQVFPPSLTPPPSPLCKMKTS